MEHTVVPGSPRGRAKRWGKDNSFWDAGFTLFELIVVLFIISLLLGVVFPSFYGLQERKLKSESRRIASLLRYLNDSSIATKQILPLKLDLQGGTLTWKDQGGERTDRFRSLDSVHLPSKGEVREGELIVFFGPMGIQEPISIHLREEKKGMTITLNPWSGRAKIFPDRE